MKSLPVRRCAAACALAVAFASPAYPWWSNEHRAIGEVAAASLNDTAKEQVAKILGNDDLGAIATYMDDLREAFFHAGPLGQDPEALQFNSYFPHNNTWHYIDLPLGTTAYTLDDPFGNPQDVVHQIEAAVDVLEGKGDPRISPKMALRMIVHFVGDLHQPLHAANGYYIVNPDHTVKLVTDPAQCKGLPNDKGGNSLHFGKGKNDELHAYWDSGGFGKVAGSDDPAKIAAVLAQTVAASGTAWKSPGDYHHWAEGWATESVVAARVAYDGIVFGKETPSNKDPAEIYRIEITLPPGYDAAAVPLATTRMSQAAYHLAEILNAIHWST